MAEGEAERLAPAGSASASRWFTTRFGSAAGCDLAGRDAGADLRLGHPPGGDDRVEVALLDRGRVQDERIHRVPARGGERMTVQVRRLARIGQVGRGLDVREGGALAHLD